MNCKEDSDAYYYCIYQFGHLKKFSSLNVKQCFGLLTTWQRDCSAWDWMDLCLIRWCAALEHHRGLCGLHWVVQIFSPTSGHSTYRNADYSALLWQEKHYRAVSSEQSEYALFWKSDPYTKPQNRFLLKFIILDLLELWFSSLLWSNALLMIERNPGHWAENPSQESQHKLFANVNVWRWELQTNCIQHLLKQQGFIVKESGCWSGLAAFQTFH